MQQMLSPLTRGLSLLVFTVYAQHQMQAKFKNKENIELSSIVFEFIQTMAELLIPKLARLIMPIFIN